MYTKEEKELAAVMLSNEGFIELLAKVFLETKDKINEELILTKNNEELGEIVKASVLAEQKVKARFNILKRLANIIPTGTKGKGVPK